MGDTPHDLEAEVESKGWDTDELVENAFVGPEDDGTTEVRLGPGLEERGAEIVNRHGTDHLVWEYDGATIDVSNQGFGDWRAEIAIPEDIARWLHGPGGTGHAVKSSFTVGTGDHVEGYIAEVWQDDDATRGVLGENVPPTRLVVRTATNYQPVVAIESLVDDLWDHAESSQRGAETAEAAFEAAKENAQSE